MRLHFLFNSSQQPRTNVKISQW